MALHFTLICVRHSPLSAVDALTYSDLSFVAASLANIYISPYPCSGVLARKRQYCIIRMTFYPYHSVALDIAWCFYFVCLFLQKEVFLFYLFNGKKFGYYES